MKDDESLKDIDLLIIDIDDSFIYHRTVAVANRIFLDNFLGLFGTRAEGFFTTKETVIEVLKVIYRRLFSFRPRKNNLYNLLVLSGSALLLHTLNLTRVAVNMLGGRMSNRTIIGLWADTVAYLGIDCDECIISKETVKKNIYPEMKQIYDEIKSMDPHMFVAAISENLSVEGRKDPIMGILGIDFMKTNMLLCKKGKINGCKKDVCDGKDKRRIAEEIIMIRRPKKVGIIIDDYDDLELLSLKDVKVVVYSPKIERFIDKKRYDAAIKVDV